MVVLDKSMEILNSKPEERTEADEDIFGKMVAATLKRLNPYQKIIARKKINGILFEIELSDYKSNNLILRMSIFGVLLTPAIIDSNMIEVTATGLVPTTT